MNELHPCRNNIWEELDGDPCANDEEPKSCRKKWVTKVTLRLFLALLVADDEEDRGKNGSERKGEASGEERKRGNLAVGKSEASKFVV